MNNKLIKRIAAVVLSVVVLSTCAFATTLSDVAYDETLTFNYASTADKVSYIAYAATIEDSEYVLGNIVAVNQFDANVTGGSVDVEIDADLLGDATHIVVKSSDTAGELDTEAAVVAVIPVEEFVYSSACTNKTTLTVTLENGVTYKDCPAFNVEFTANVAGTATLTGLKKVVAGVEDDFRSVSAILDVYKNVPLTAGSSFTFANIYIVGMPTDGTVDINTVSIKPVVDFVKAQ